MKIKSTAPGKLILLGEYAVLEGAPALVMAVDRFAEATLQTTSSNQCIIAAPAIGISELSFTFDARGEINFNPQIEEKTRKKLSFFLSALGAASTYFGNNFYPPPSFKIILDTSQFFNADNQKLGLGSSAALTAALISALGKFQDENFNMQKEERLIFKTSLQIHRMAQGNIGSGIDVAASVLGGVLKYQIVDSDFNALPFYEKLTIPSDLNILPIWAKEPASTTQFVRKVSEFRSTKSIAFNEIMDRMKHSSNIGIEAIQQENANLFIETVQQYYEEMDILGKKSRIPIVSEMHRQIHNIVRTEGGAYKPSGAGGGDLGTAFCHSKEINERIKAKLINAGFQVINLRVANKGIQVRNF